MSDDKTTIRVLRSSFELTIHSKEAQKLIEGRIIERDSELELEKKYTINGLELYSKRLNTIWYRVKNDDPYAEMVLIEIERRLERAKNKIHHATKDAEIMLKKSPPGISISVSSSTNPIKISLNHTKYYTIHAKLAAVLIADFDFLIRKLKSCIEIGQLTKSQYKKRIESLSTVIRGVLITPSVYNNMNIDRKDILQSTEKGKAAIEKFGLVPMDMLNNNQHSKFGPVSLKYNGKQ
jgi:integrating conjugative element protein (TIGR03761 family)